MRRLLEADRALFSRLAAMHSPVLDATMPRLTHSADHGKIWLTTAAALYATGNRRNRRAALRGLVALGVTSAVVNGPMKGLMRRQRPIIDGVGLQRRTRRRPRTSSFPSGHSASAAAFATAVALEHPALGAALAPVAAGITFSRVYTGVHYPLDVVVGAAVGAAAATATTRWWPVSPAEPLPPQRTLTRGEAQPNADGSGLVIVVNPSAGPALSSNPAETLRAALPGAKVVEVADPAAIDDALQAAVKEARVLGVAGGDGTVSAAAALAQEHDLPLLVVPGGTLNHLARDLGIDSVEDAVAALQAGNVAALDVAEIDGRPFVNTASFGSYPELVDARERWEGRIGKWPALLVALARVVARGTTADVEINGQRHQVSMAFLGNGHYHPAGFGPSWRERLDEGVLDVRWVDGARRWARLRVVVAVLAGRLGRCRVYHEERVRSVTIRSREGGLRLARDGETFDGSTEVVVRKRERPLWVVVPEPG